MSQLKMRILTLRVQQIFQSKSPGRCSWCASGVTPRNEWKPLRVTPGKRAVRSLCRQERNQGTVNICLSENYLCQSWCLTPQSFPRKTTKNSSQTCLSTKLECKKNQQQQLPAVLTALPLYNCLLQTSCIFHTPNYIIRMETLLCEALEIYPSRYFCCVAKHVVVTSYQELSPMQAIGELLLKQKVKCKMSSNHL